MSNETKRDVFTRVNKFARELRVYDAERMESKEEIDRDYQEDMSAYDAALPDDMPVIPKAVGEYIKVCKKHDWNLTDSLMSMSLQVIYDTELIGDDTFARAWLLSVWRVEETGEIVKLEAEVRDEKA